MLMLKKLVKVLVVVMLSTVASPSLSAEAQHSDYGNGFLYNGFKDAAANFNFDDGVADITSNGLLRLTNNFNSTYQIDIIKDSMYVGFSSSTSFVLTSHYIMGWSFMINNGTALPIISSQLPELPRRKASKSLLFGVELPIIIPVLVLTFIIGILFVVRKIRNEKFKDLVEDWELDYGRQRRPIEMNKSETEEGEVLVDWVLYCWRSGRILQTSDPNLMNEYVKEEMELVLKIGLLCSRNNPKARPSMRQVMQYLDGDVPLPETELWGLDFDDPSMSSSFGERPSHVIEMVSLTTSSRSTSVAESLLSGPR
ncbi:hypothetical protein MKW92_022678 [Papaver armeniacum]|nr:hypothetical protein MKW92_022678 [Papaver armeniacum]